MRAFMSYSVLLWIIDSTASDHMTGPSNLFSSYTLYTSLDKVKIIDGTFSSISGKCLVYITPSLSLFYILHIPSFAANLLSISRLTVV